MVRIQACRHCATVSWDKGLSRVISLHGEELLSFGVDARGRFVMVNCPVCYQILAQESAQQERDGGGMGLSDSVGFEPAEDLKPRLDQ